MAYMHQLGWAVVCLILLVSVGGLWVHAQTLQNKVNELDKQLIASKRPAPNTCKVKGEWNSGMTKRMEIDKRSYLVHVPQNFLSYEYYPLVMFYPGKGATAEAAEAAYGLDALPAIVVYPSPTMGKDGFWAWQGAPYSSGSDDVDFTTDILDRLQGELCIDRTKTYAAGFSNGGGFVSLLSCKAPDRFAAYAVIAGAMYSPDGGCKPSRPAPLISIHGDSDPVVPYTGSIARGLPLIDSWSSLRAETNGCSSKNSFSGGQNVYVTVWNGCNNNATVQNVRIQGGGHTWGQRTNEMLWQFLSKFSL